jgi:hypothetical protein
MREIVRKAIEPQTQPVASTPSTGTTKKPTTGKSSTKPTPPPGGTQDLSDACAYHPTTP